MEIVGHVFSFGIMILMIIMLIKSGLHMKKENMSFDDVVISDAPKLFKTLAAVSTAGEIMSLTIAAFQSGRMDITSAFIRYSIPGIIEMVMSIYFISRINKYVTDALKDGVVTIYERFLIMIKSFVPFTMSFFATSIIAFFYLEATNNILVVNSTGGSWMTLLPILNLNFIDDPDLILEKLAESGIENATVNRLEFSALFLIYSSTFFNLILGFIAVFTIGDISFVPNGGFKNLFKKKKKEDKEEKKDIPDINNISGLYTKLDLLLGIKQADLEKFLIDYLAFDFAKGQSIQPTVITNAEVKAGTKTAKDIFDNVFLKLLTDNTTGIPELEKLDAEIAAKHTTLKATENLYNSTRNPTEKATLKTGANDLKQKINKHKSIATALCNELKLLSFTRIPTYKTPAIKDSEDLIARINTL